MPQVSIIVPNFNHAPYLKRRLDSIFEQTIQDFELIFLDDASMDDSLEIFGPYAKDPRVMYVVNETNSGNPFSQWNKGFSMASGEYVWIAESDDNAEPTFLERMISALERHPTAGLATCRSIIIDERDKNLGIFDAYHWYADRERWHNGYFNRGADEIENYMVHQNTIPNASATLFKSSVIEDGLQAPENMIVAGDWLFWVEILSRSDISHVGEPLNYFRREHLSSQRARSAALGNEVLEGFVVQERIVELTNMTDHKKLLTQMGLMRRWLSVASRHRIRFESHLGIYCKFLKSDFGTLVAKSLQLLMASATLILMPLTFIPGFQRFAVWIRDRLTHSRPARSPT